MTRPRSRGGHTSRVETRPWPGYSAQKNYAASRASHDWIFSLDADERVTPALAAEIRSLLATEPPHRGYRVPRISHYLGRWIRGTDWYPDYQLRLYDRRAGEWNGRRVHESVQLTNGAPGQLTHDLQHYPYRDISQHLATIDRYTTLAAEQMPADGKRPSIAGVALHPPFAFLRNYVLRGGFRNGSAGFVVSALNSYYVFLKLAKKGAPRRLTIRCSPSTSTRPGRGAAGRTRCCSRCSGCGRSATGRCSSRTRPASCGSARRKGSSWSRSRRRPRWT